MRVSCGVGWFGGQQPQTVYQQAPPKKSGMGMGTVLAAGTRFEISAHMSYSPGVHTGGAGLLGGALLGEAFDGGTMLLFSIVSSLCAVGQWLINNDLAFACAVFQRKLPMLSKDADLFIFFVHFAT